MSGFQVPDSFSSSPPATPEKKSGYGHNPFSFGASNPSTTPAGPPPSSTGTFTPAGLPRSSILGSSELGRSNPIKPLSFSQNTSAASRPNFNASQFSPTPNFMRSAADTGFQASRQGDSQSQEDYSDEDGEGEDEDMGEGRYNYQRDFQEDRNQFEDSYGYGDADLQTDEDDFMGDYQSETQAANRNPYERSSSDLLLAPPMALKDGRGNQSRSLSGQARKSTYKHIAKDLCSQMGIPAIEESNEVVLQTEAIISNLYDEGFAEENDIPLQHALMNVPSELIDLWSECAQRTQLHQSEEYSASIGPGPGSSNFEKAEFIASLALRVHHPKITSTITMIPPEFSGLPQTMLEWIDGNHRPFPSQVEEIQVHRPSPANHCHFWEITLNSLLRGGVAVVVNILRTAGWRHARTGSDGFRNSAGQAGYSGVALANVERVIDAAIRVLSQCPAIRGDWNIRGSEWTMFRIRASSALDDLKRFAEGRNSDIENSDDSDEAPNGRSTTFARTAKRAQSQVPWDLYQNLLTLYGIIIGDSDAIIAHASDWCEATVGLFVWWDEGKEDRRLALGRSRGQHRINLKDSDADIYLRKLQRSFETATSEGSELQVNTLDPVEVALAALLEGDNETVVNFLRGWSGPISSAVAEIASLAGWLPQAEPQSLINMSLDQDDLDLLGLGSSPSKVDSIKDQTLIAYATSLFSQELFRADGLQSRNGWEIAIAILGRLDSIERTQDMVGEFLGSFVLDSSTTVDKLWRLLNDIGMTGHAESTAQTYAKQLADHTHKYGEALWYYSLSHKTQSVKDVLDLLISLSLVQSTAYPPEAEMDNHLKHLISSPKNALSEMSTMDVEAAELLQKLLSGYATLRKFYTLRDEELLSTERKSQRSSIAIKKEAALALFAIITSSDDNIRGGLYDEEREAVVNVDFLLALLGEAMVFVNQPTFSLTASQIDILLKAIEDLHAVGPRIYSACSDFLETVIASSPDLRGSTPADMLRKSTSNMSGTSSFSLVGSSMLASQLKQSMGSSGVLVKGNIKRGWDWRRNLDAKTTGVDVLRVLRLGLAKDLAKAWLREVDGM